LAYSRIEELCRTGRGTQEYTSVRSASLVEQRRFEPPVSFALLLYESGL
jgi:hypothetical protein